MHIAFEGCDGVGKTTIRNALVKYLTSLKEPVITIGQHSWLNSRATEILVNVREKRKHYCKEVIIEAYLEDKALHSKYTVDPHKNDCFIIADRCYISDVVYLSQIYDFDMHKLRSLHVNKKYSMPDLFIYVYTDVDTAYKRILSREKHTKHYEEPVTMLNIMDGYERYFQEYDDFYHDRLLTIDNTDADIDSNVRIIYEFLKNEANKKNL